jgi:signal transduction histidine kinase
VNLLLANAILLYLGSLLIARSGTVEPSRRRALDFALAALVIAATLPAAIFVAYPAIEGLISPLLVVAPFGVFPLLTAAALSRAASGAAPRTSASVRLRLSFLFLAAVETGFVAGIGYFWLSNTWQQLLADLSLYHQQRVRITHLNLETPAARGDLAEIAAYAQSSGNRSLAERARAALEAGDVAAADAAVRRLGDRYRALGEHLEKRRVWLGRMDAGLVVGLVLLGVLQAVAFMIAVRRWLMRPIDELSAATAVIATGDLDYRSQLDSSAEFASLANSINAMAASLSVIQQRVDADRTAREQAAAAARDLERRRLARELHDGILQDLSAVKLAVEGEARRPSQERLAGIAEGIIQVIVSLRGVVDELRPQDLSHVSLGAAIESHARALAQRHAVELEIDTRDADVYRIAQEAVSNALRHGAPSRLSVRLQRRGSDAVLEVSDDGVGFDPATVVRGSGLIGMAERAAALGARLEVRSRPRGGTSVLLAVPPRGAPAPAGSPVGRSRAI